MFAQKLARALVTGPAALRTERVDAPHQWFPVRATMPGRASISSKTPAGGDSSVGTKAAAGEPGSITGFIRSDKVSRTARIMPGTPSALSNQVRRSSVNGNSRFVSAAAQSSSPVCGRAGRNG